MKPMKDNIFLDSNIFLYGFSDTDLKKHEIAKDILLSDNFTISTQIINEVSNNMLKKLGFSEPNIIEFINSCYKRYSIINFSKDILLAASMIRMKYHYSYWDSAVIASALENNCDILYSEDLHAGQEIEKKLKVINPFK
jgi:predicted nucleic acid-binding protein